MEKRYQIFVSSTYADLKEERQKVIQTLMTLDCIPAGMELFPAIDEEQFQFIKRIIDDCDYYILIIGGRYGSLTAEGISYTEEEYDYAVSTGKKVMAFVHKAPEEIPAGKTDMDSVLCRKLDDFRKKVETGRLVSYWTTADQLPGQVALSVTSTLKRYPATGWVRADSVSNQELLRDLNILRKEKEELRSKLAALASSHQTIPIDHLASLDETFSIKVKFTYYVNSRSHDTSETINLSWGDLFAIISPDILTSPNDTVVPSLLGSALCNRYVDRTASNPRVQHDDYQTIKVQLLAYNFINMGVGTTVSGSRGYFWSLTDYGKKVMLQIRSVKEAQDVTSDLHTAPMQ